MRTNTLLTNADFLKALQASELSEVQKRKFEGLIERMTDEEKVELGQLINESHKAKKEFEAEKKRQLGELNLATEEKMKKVEKQEIKAIRNDFEKFDQAQTEKELPALQESLNQNEQKIKYENLVPNIINSGKNPIENTQKLHNEGRNFILILLSLVILAGTLIFGLSTL